MKAAVVEGPDRVAVRDVPEPEPGDYEALCEILYGATCSGTDSHIVACQFPWLSPLPTIPGHESIGRVLEVGPKVRHLKEGDLVTRVGTPPVGDCSVTWGGFAEFGIATDHHAARENGVPQEQWFGKRNQQVLPPGTDPAEATLFITWRETLSFTTRMGYALGKTVLILGSGGNGLAFMAHARNAGCSPRVMVGSPRREAVGIRAGAETYVDYHSESLQDAVAKHCPDGFDLVIDAVGKVGLADVGLSLLKPGGTIAIYGIDDFDQCTLNPNRARGSFTVYGDYLDEAEAHDEVVRLYQEGKLDASIWIDAGHPFDLADFREAIDAVRQRRMVKALVRIRG